MRDAQVRHVAVVNDVDRLVAAISIDHLVLVAQNVGAGADAANIVRFHAFSRMGRRGRGIRQSVQIRRRGRSSVCGGPGRLRGAACGDQRHAQTGRCAVLGHRVATLPTYLPTYLPTASRRRPGPVGGRPRAASAGSSESFNLCAEPQGNSRGSGPHGRGSATAGVVLVVGLCLAAVRDHALRGVEREIRGGGRSWSGRRCVGHRPLTTGTTPGGSRPRWTA